MFNLAIVDDESLFRQFLKKVLPWDELGFNICWEARDGEDALNLIKTVPPHLMLVDITMPFIDGIELTKRLKQDYPSINVILVTGHEEFEYARTALRLGVSDYLLKPFTADELKATIEKIKEKLDKENNWIFSNVASDTSDNFYYPRSFYDKFIIELRHLNHEFIKKSIDDTFSTIESNNLSSDYIYGICTSLISLGLAYLSENNITIDQCFEKGYSPYNTLKQCKTLLEVTIFIKDFFNSIISFKASNKPSKTKNLVDKTKKYIDENYANSDLCLDLICKHVYVNESYLRSLFKKEIGITITDYITQTRMNKAKELISKGNIRYSELSEAVGYNDASYFSKCFKKYFGVTPKEYEASMML